jgi:cytochrome P450
MALKPFVLSDGSRVEVGEWICTAPRGMMLDARHYTAPLEFQGFRFVDPGVLEKHVPQTTSHTTSQMQGVPSKFTDVGDWLLWGTGRSAW